MSVTKIVDGVKHTYQYVDGLLMYETRGDLAFSYDYDAYGHLSCINYIWRDGTTSWKFYVACNSRGDVTAIYAADGTLRAKYTYDSWGNTLSITNANGNDLTALYGADSVDANNIGNLNKIRYRGYYYDSESGLYYLQSRYYDPQVKRFVNADGSDVVTATPMALTDKNLFAYCDNNPIVRADVGGAFWDTVLDVVSLVSSVAEVVANPANPWAWAGLAGDAIELIPFVTGVGEVTRAVKTTVKVVDKATDVVDTAKTIYKTADAASDIRKATGSYEILYKSGKNYIGKGGFNRAITSATRNATKYGDEVTSIMWKSAPNSRSAFIDEYLMQKRFGGVLSSNRDLLTYNKIWSPGRRYFGD